MLTEVVQDFVEDVGEGCLSLHKGVVYVLLMFSQTLSGGGGREHVSKGMGDQGANEMPAIGDILGFPPHPVRTSKGGGHAWKIR